MTTNFEMVLSTVKMLSNSQGFYSRLQNTIDNWSDDEYKKAEKYFNSLPNKFNDSVDVVMFLEG